MRIKRVLWVLALAVICGMVVLLGGCVARDEVRGGWWVAGLFVVLLLVGVKQCYFPGRTIRTKHEYKFLRMGWPSYTVVEINGKQAEKLEKIWDFANRMGVEGWELLEMLPQSGHFPQGRAGIDNDYASTCMVLHRKVP